MRKFFKDHSVQLVAMCPVVLFVAVLVCSHAVVFATSSDPVGLVRSGSMTIEGKSDDAVIVSERHFVVTEATTILDINGNRIRLSDLPIPCEGEIQYQLRMDQDPLCLKIILTTQNTR